MSKRVVLEIRASLGGVAFIRVPYYLEDLKRDPNIVRVIIVTLVHVVAAAAAVVVAVKQQKQQ